MLAESDERKATLSLVLSYRGRERRYELNIPSDVVARLVVEASFKGISFADVVASRIIGGEHEGNGK